MLFKRTAVGILPASLDIGNYGFDSFGILGCWRVAGGYPGERGDCKNDEDDKKTLDGFSIL